MKVVFSDKYALRNVWKGYLVLLANNIIIGNMSEKLVNCNTFTLPLFQAMYMYIMYVWKKLFFSLSSKFQKLLSTIKIMCNILHVTKCGCMFMFMLYTHFSWHIFTDYYFNNSTSKLLFGCVDILFVYKCTCYQIFLWYFMNKRSSHTCEISNWTWRNKSLTSK